MSALHLQKRAGGGRRLGGLLALAMLAAGSGCTEGAGRATEVPVHDQALLILTEEQLISRCMTAKGFQYAPVGPSAHELEASRQLLMEQIYGGDDLTAAKRDGYGLRAAMAEPVALHDPVRDGVNNRYVQSLPPERQRAYFEALFGRFEQMVNVDLPTGGAIRVSATGCVADARKVLFGPDLLAYMRADHLRANLDAMAYQRVASDHRYLETLQGWRGCMSARGYRYERPEAARRAIAETYLQATDLDGVQGQERGVAVADATCAREVRLAAVGRGLHAGHAQEVSRELHQELNSHATLSAVAVTRARRLMAAEPQR